MYGLPGENFRCIGEEYDPGCNVLKMPVPLSMFSLCYSSPLFS